MKHGKKMFVHGVIRNAIATGVLSAALLSLIVAAQAADDAGALAQWREAIAHTNVQAAGCFEASYPSMEWNQVECVEAPAIPFIPRGGRGGPTVGNGNDYAAEVSSGLISETVGSFPKVTGVKGEEGVGGANSYSLQLNSNFMSNNKACDGAKDPPKCLAWLQYVYSSDSKAAFMQYWLIHWDNTCPSGWNSYGGDCYTNSNAVPVPKEGITKLKTLKISGSAVVGGLDTLIMYVGTKAYKTTGEDSVVYLSTGWTKSEFNVFGDGGGSEAYFNSGSSITVEIAVTNGTTNAPICAPDAGTSGETNNLNLGSNALRRAARRPISSSPSRTIPASSYREPQWSRDGHRRLVSAWHSLSDRLRSTIRVKCAGAPNGNTWVGFWLFEMGWGFRPRMHRYTPQPIRLHE